MKNKKTIPIFVPHKGCPNDCVFCNQKKITGIEKEQTREEIIDTIENALKTIPDESLVEIAFFGGSFTAINIKKQIELLEIAGQFISRGKVNTIRISTRPDAIDQEILDLLKKYKVSIIELGVQSMDEEILKKANRGHNTACVIDSSKLIKANGFSLGLQMMIGLPGDTEEKTKNTVDEFIKIKPDFVRIYPVLVIKETELKSMLDQGIYKPWDVQRAAVAAKDAFKKFIKNDIEVIRIGLQASDTINLESDVVDGPFHPAFGEIVLSLVFRDIIESFITSHPDLQSQKEIHIKSAKSYISKIIGNKKSNKIYFKEKYNLDLITKEITPKGLMVINKEEIKINF